MDDEFEMSGGPEDLTATEAARLAVLREVVEGYRRAELDAARALREIREGRLYRPRRWDAFCEDCLPITRRHADRLIAYATLTGEMGPRGPAPTSEKQSRPLGSLSREEQDGVAAMADWQTGGNGFEGLSAKDVADLVREVTGEAGGALIPIDERALVQTKRGPMPLGRSGFLPLLDGMEGNARSIRRLGPNALVDAVRAVPPDDRERRADQIRLITEVARDLVDATSAWPGGVEREQEPLPVEVRDTGAWSGPLTRGIGTAAGPDGGAGGSGSGSSSHP